MAMHYLMQTDTSEYDLYENHDKTELHINVSNQNCILMQLKQLFCCFENYLMVDKFKGKLK